MVDHMADVKKYAKGAVDEAAVAGIAKTYRLVLSKADTRYVACADPSERERVQMLNDVRNAAPTGLSPPGRPGI